MPNDISGLLSEILNAQYGEDVRTAIHDSIEQCYDDVTSTKTIADAAVEDVTTAIQNANTILGDVSEYIEDDVTVASAIASAIAAATEAYGSAEEADDAKDEAVAAATSATNAASSAISAASTAQTTASQALGIANIAQAIIDRWDGTDGETALSTMIDNAISNANTAANEAEEALESISGMQDTLEDLTQQAGEGVSALNAIVDHWNGEGEYENNGISDEISSVVSSARTAGSEVQAIADRWTGDDGETGLSTLVNSALTRTNNILGNQEEIAQYIENDVTIANIIADVQEAITNANTKASVAESMGTLANNAATAAGSATTEAVSATSDARSATSDATAAGDYARSMGLRVQNLQVTSQSVSTETPSSARVDLITEGTSQYYRISFLLSKGPKGDSMVIKGEAYASVAALQQAVPYPNVGDMYNIGSEPPYDIYRWTGSFWENQGQIASSIDNLTETEINNIWAGTYTPGAGSKYIDDTGLVQLVTEKIVDAHDTLQDNIDTVASNITGLSTVDTTIASNFAAEYSASASYNVGDFCVYDKVLYRCITAIATGGEQWTSGHWTATTVKAALDTKVSTDGSKVLSSNDFTNELKSKLEAIEAQANKTIVDSSLQTNSNNPVRNSIISQAVTSLTTDFAPLYSVAQSYAVGDYCTFVDVNGRKIYRCTTAISAPGEDPFNIDHWTSVSTMGELKSEQSRINEALSRVSAVTSKVNGAIQNFANIYNPNIGYDVGDFCIYNSVLYRCNTAISSGEDPFDITHWTQTTVGAALGNVDFSAIETELEDISEQFADAYDPTASYDVGDFCVYEKVLYKCNTAIATGGEQWTSGHWTATKVTDELGADVDLSEVEEEIDSLRDQIADTYDEEQSYLVGSYCIYDGVLYKCIAETSGDNGWVSGHWTSTTVGDCITDLQDQVYYNSIVVPFSTFNGTGNFTLTFYNSHITSMHKVTEYYLSNPAAQTGEWTVVTSDEDGGKVTVSGSINGSTNMKITLTRAPQLSGTVVSG